MCVKECWADENVCTWWNAQYTLYPTQYPCPYTRSLCTYFVRPKQARCIAYAVYMRKQRNTDQLCEQSRLNKCRLSIFGTIFFVSEFLCEAYASFCSYVEFVFSFIFATTFAPIFNRKHVVSKKIKHTQTLKPFEMKRTRLHCEISKKKWKSLAERQRYK